jgi:hypothetical protein
LIATGRFNFVSVAIHDPHAAAAEHRIDAVMIEYGSGRELGTECGPGRFACAEVGGVVFRQQQLDGFAQLHVVSRELCDERSPLGRGAL